jgi:hypothetical protein
MSGKMRSKPAEPTSAATAEIRKLAHALGLPTQRLAPLSSLPPEDLRVLRTQIAEALFQADRHHFARVAALSKAVPVAMAAKLTEHVFPPLLAARTAELIDPHRAVELVARLSDGYLADVSAAMHPERAPHVLAGIPAERIAKVGAELARRGEWVVIAGFLAHVSPEALNATVDLLTGEQLLRVGFVLDDKDRLDEVSAMLSDWQLDQMISSAHDQALWTELDDLLTHLTDERVARLSQRFAVAEPQVRAAADKAVGEGVLSARTVKLLTSAA